MNRLYLLLYLVFSITTILFSQKPEALRIDYVHNGNNEKETIHIYRLIAEPYFSGNRNHDIYPFDYGNYKVEVSLKKDNELIYSYHYNSLFNEWQATKMANSESRSFQESVKIPFPEGPVNIIFYSRDKKLNWNKIYSYDIDPASNFIIKDKPKEYHTRIIYDAGNYKEKMDLLIIPDGYTKDEMVKYHKDAKRFRDYLLTCAPFDKHRGKINVWTIDVISEESGTDKPTKGQWKNTALDASFNTFGSQRYLTTYNHFALREAASCTPYDLIFILVNDTLYGGGGIFNFYSVATSDDDHADFLMVHEFGHHFGCLGDEYYTSEVAVEDYHKTNVEPYEPNLTTLVDFDTKWKDMLDNNTPIPTPDDSSHKNTIGVYEGGGYLAKGVYRPFPDCTMKSPKYDNFCPVCQRALVKMLHYYTGEVTE
ncbi:MAG: IgA Peptidase M64 [Bacteroidales bacterium]|nr:IgA Peptidase M64 [Bacteroidales bacterium]